MQDKDLEEILRDVYVAFDKTTLEANPEKSMQFMHPDGVILEKGKTATYGYENLLKLWTDWYNSTGAYEFKRSNCKYTGGGDWIINEFNVEIQAKSQKLTGKVTHIWRRFEGKWLIYLEEYDLH